MTRIQYSKVGLSVIFITVSPSDLLFWSVSGIRAELCERVHIESRDCDEQKTYRRGRR
jgi:hypothetical protein